MRCARRLLAAALAGAGCGAAAAATGGAGAEEPSCPAGASEGACAAGAGAAAGAEYYWPRARGATGRYGHTKLRGPQNLSASLAWTWEHPTYGILNGAAVIDDKRNIYVPSCSGYRKFSPDGEVLWTYHSPQGLTNANPSIAGGVLYGSCITGWMFALDMDTGKEIWTHHTVSSAEMDSPYVEVINGVVVAAFDRKPTNSSSIPGNTHIFAVRAKDGRRLWDYQNDKVLWNFHAMDVGDGTFVTMDVNGGAYRFSVRNGTKLWYSPPPEEANTSFTDGGVTLGPGNAVAYTCSNLLDGMSGGGALRAYRVSDGKFLWEAKLPEACVSWPAVSPDNRTVVVPVGALPFPIPPALIVLVYVLPYSLLPPLLQLSLCISGCCCCRRIRKPARRMWWFWLVPFVVLFVLFPALHYFSIWLGERQLELLWHNPLEGYRNKPHEVLAFDAQSGKPRWRFNDIKPWGKFGCRNDEDNAFRNVYAGNPMRPVCGPASWSAPSIDSEGTVYAGAQNGILYAINDRNGDGIIDTATEVDTLDIDAAALHGGPSFAPGMMAFASCQRLHVFRL